MSWALTSCCQLNRWAIYLWHWTSIKPVHRDKTCSYKTVINLHLVSLFRSADHDCGPGGLWEILPVIGHAGGDADNQWESLLEQVRIYTFAQLLSKLLWCLWTLMELVICIKTQRDQNSPPVVSWPLKQLNVCVNVAENRGVHLHARSIRC